MFIRAPNLLNRDRNHNLEARFVAGAGFHYGTKCKSLFSSIEIPLQRKKQGYLVSVAMIRLKGRGSRKCCSKGTYGKRDFGSKARAVAEDCSRFAESEPHLRTRNHFD